MALLETHGLSVTFGGLVALNDLDLTVEAGQLVGLIGPNGAGKTACIDGLTGFVPTSGRIVFDGREIGSWPAHRRARAGLGRTWQAVELFDDLTVRENLLVAAQRPGRGTALTEFVRPRRARRDPVSVEASLERVGIASLAARRPDELSQGQRKLVGVARALAGSPSLVCMDEPAAGLDSQESRELGGRLRDIVDSGVTILLVDHDMSLVLGVCDRVHVLEFGVKIAEGDPDEIAGDPRVVEAYLGAGSTTGAPGPDVDADTGSDTERVP